MKNQIAYLVLFLFLSAIALSCKKNLGLLAPATEYYIKCKVDGKEKHFKIPDSALVNWQPVTGIYSFAAGAVDDLASMTNISIIVNDATGQKIVTSKTYNTVITGGITQTQAFISWSNLTGESYTSPLSLLGPVKESAEIVLDEITDKYVKGRFKGKLLPDEVNSAVVKHVLTDGTFYLPLKKGTVAGAGGLGDGFVEGKYGTTNINIREGSDALNVVYGSLITQTDGGGNKTYSVSVSAQSNLLLANYQALTLSITDNKPIEAKTYNLPVAGALLYPGFLSTFYYKQAGSIKTAVSNVGGASQTKATVTFTKLGKAKGEYIEGSFSVENYTNVSLNPVNLTDGKFKVKIK